MHPAAKAGSLAAEAALVASRAPLSRDENYLRALRERVARSRDPEAFLAMADAMGPEASSLPHVFGPESGTEEATLAWTLAACRTGLDCRSNGALMTTYCLAGICGPYNNFEQLVFEGLLPASERNRINEMVGRVISYGE
ncbi:hypothetical protein [Pseudoxanthomonas sp. PXM02]|uniref:hypothetical protein n=1 Tax=Pseudoxanthomonas sp. PXM02 TaxID=2769294 RepID=UPI0017872A0E|nr:hypothetical protein [Pseudoxanthomonas sp. PXM02]MBD9478862.1 hypothetical protein [Pseudoxanthomonas sp. PXM02]